MKLETALDDLLTTSQLHRFRKQSELDLALDKILLEKSAFIQKVKKKVKRIYDRFDQGKLLADRSPERLTASDLWVHPARFGMESARKAYKFHAKLYNKLENRYGPGYAKAIVGTWAAAAPLPGPMSPVVAAPVIGVAELHRLIRRRRGQQV